MAQRFSNHVHSTSVHNLCSKRSYQGHKIILKGFFLIERLPVAVKFNWLYKTRGLEGSTLLCNLRNLTKALPIWQQLKCHMDFTSWISFDRINNLSNLNPLIRNSPNSYVYRTIIWQRWAENQNQELKSTSQKQRSWWAQRIFTLFWKTKSLEFGFGVCDENIQIRPCLKPQNFTLSQMTGLQTEAHLASNPNRSPLQPGDRASVTTFDGEGCFEASSGALEKSTEKRALCASITSTLACNSQKFSYLAFYLTLHVKSILLHDSKIVHASNLETQQIFAYIQYTLLWGFSLQTWCLLKSL